MKDYRVVLLAGSVLCAALLGGPACSSPDPGSISFTERPSGAGGDTSSSSSSSSSSSTSSSGGGTDSGAAAPDKIFGTTTFAYMSPGNQANGANLAHAGTVVGKDCATNAACHGAGGNKPWTFCGTLYGAGGKTTIAKGEIKVVGPDGADVGSAYTDDSGNFWYEGGALPAGSTVGVRADGVPVAQHMNGMLAATNNGCSSTACHGSVGTGPVHVP